MPRKKKRRKRKSSIKGLLKRADGESNQTTLCFSSKSFATCSHADIVTCRSANIPDATGVRKIVEYTLNKDGAWNSTIVSP